MGEGLTLHGSWGGPMDPALAGDGTFFVQLLVCYPHAALRARTWLQTFNQVNSSLRVCLRSAHPRGSALWFGQRGFKVLVVLRASCETALMSQIVYKQLEPEAS